MSKFDEAANDILRKLDENFINSAADAIQHTWAQTIAHPGLGEEDEEFAVLDHSLTSDGIIEEYYVQYNGQLVAIPADEAKVVVIKEHDEETAHGAKAKKKVKKLSSDEEDEDKDFDDEQRDQDPHRHKGLSDFDAEQRDQDPHRHKGK